jgi:hypothetical protein
LGDDQSRDGRPKRATAVPMQMVCLFIVCYSGTHKVFYRNDSVQVKLKNDGFKPSWSQKDSAILIYKSVP